MPAASARVAAGASGNLLLIAPRVVQPSWVRPIASSDWPSFSILSGPRGDLGYFLICSAKARHRAGIILLDIIDVADPVDRLGRKIVVVGIGVGIGAEGGAGFVILRLGQQVHRRVELVGRPARGASGVVGGSVPRLPGGRASGVGAQRGLVRATLWLRASSGGKGAPGCKLPGGPAGAALACRAGGGAIEALIVAAGAQLLRRHHAKPVGEILLLLVDLLVQQIDLMAQLFIGAGGLGQGLGQAVRLVFQRLDAALKLLVLARQIAELG